MCSTVLTVFLFHRIFQRTGKKLGKKRPCKVEGKFKQPFERMFQKLAQMFQDALKAFENTFTSLGLAGKIALRANPSTDKPPTLPLDVRTLLFNIPTNKNYPLPQSCLSFPQTHLCNICTSIWNICASSLGHLPLPLYPVAGARHIVLTAPAPNG